MIELFDPGLTPNPPLQPGLTAVGVLPGGRLTASFSGHAYAAGAVTATDGDFATQA
jgi:hypothetical protein